MYSGRDIGQGQSPAHPLSARGRTKQITFTAGTKIPDQILELDSQQTPIRNVLVDCSKAPQALVYEGTSPFGTPFTVNRGSFRNIPIAGTSAVYIVFPNIPGKDGHVFIAWSGEPIPFISNEIVGGDTAFSSPLLVQQSSSIYPPGAQYINSGNTSGPLTGILSPLTVASIALQPGQAFYLHEFRTSGISKQLFVPWNLQYSASSSLNVTLAQATYGDLQLEPAIPMQCTWIGITAGTMNIQIAWTNPASTPPIGTLNVSALVVGYAF